MKHLVVATALLLAAGMGCSKHRSAPPVATAQPSTAANPAVTTANVAPLTPASAGVLAAPLARDQQAAVRTARAKKHHRHHHRHRHHHET